MSALAEAETVVRPTWVVTCVCGARRGRYLDRQEADREASDHARGTKRNHRTTVMQESMEFIRSSSDPQ